ncbi:uncharacterized protein BX663DRAFT_525322 [Cokeromyces recurvatus]|uniref:uncharacterized protein n=1 Tax=Cokeromyces recurvatus TaxID=90255 RepID=UPI00221F45D2|nr:uncharacterized protein BX663DRAFT_525322 [Cokeromyces recurvatus]KAI7898287.1 hypothetical protein BX663DRAFT_525322 [Cokeromyces recurvatus]
MQLTNNNSMSTMIMKNNDQSFSDLSDQEPIFVERPMVTSIQPWAHTIHTSAPPYNSISTPHHYPPQPSMMPPTPSVSPCSSNNNNTNQSCFPPTSASYIIPPTSAPIEHIPTTAAMASNNTSYLLNNRNEIILMPPSQQQQQQQQQQPYDNLLSMGYHPPHHDHSPSPSPPPEFRHNSISSDSSVPSSHLQQDLIEESLNTHRGRTQHKTGNTKRDKALERNRQAALRCRQRKKEWLNQLQSSVDILTKENRALEQQTLTLREEILNLKALLLVHRDCSHAHLTANSINFDNLIFRKNSTTTSSPTTTTNDVTKSSTTLHALDHLTTGNAAATTTTTTTTTTAAATAIATSASV